METFLKLLPTLMKGISAATVLAKTDPAPAYRAIRVLLKKAETEAEPADIFLRTQRFPWMTEVWPWPIICEDSISTIQRPEGCVAKHRKVRPI